MTQIVIKKGENKSEKFKNQTRIKLKQILIFISYFE